jgi:hypothetical protein
MYDPENPASFPPRRVFHGFEGLLPFSHIPLVHYMVQTYLDTRVRQQPQVCLDFCFVRRLSEQKKRERRRLALWGSADICPYADEYEC